MCDFCKSHGTPVCKCVFFNFVLVGLTENRQHARRAPGRHHVGGHPAVPGVPADLHLHLLLLPRASE